VNIKVAVSGACSFTGLWIARALKDKGYAVLAHISEQPDECVGLKGIRLKLLHDIANVTFGIKAEDGSMLTWIRENKPDIWIHHHHWMPNFRSPDYDLDKALEIGVKPIPALVSELANNACKGIVYTGTYFEPNEGGKSEHDEVTPYSNSKALVWKGLKAEAEQKHLPVSKCVLPDPVGPFENEDRVIPLLIKKSLNGEQFALMSPRAIGDRVSVFHVAETYCSLVDGLLDGRAQIVRPSGWVGPLDEWIKLVLEELVKRQLGIKPCSVIKNESPKKPGVLMNSKSEKLNINWPSVWKQYAEWLRQTHYLV